MHSSCSLLVLLLPPLLLLVATTGPAGALSEEEKHMMVELHNLYRAQVSPPAANMLQMRWDEELAAFAKAYAQQCVWGHNKERGRRGENLFAITDGLDVPLAMEEWHHEHEHYNLSAATCAAGQMCGHYTQVVWARTERIGCGSHFCEKLQGVDETNIHLLVCNYEPPGNVKGQRPYQEGTPCSQCSSGYRCKNSLCGESGEGEAEAKLPHSSEVLASVFPAQNKPGDLKATLDHKGHTSSKSLSNSPSASATANAMGGRTLALQSSLPGAEGPEKPGIQSGLNSNPGYVWGLILGLLLLPHLVLAGIF
ncbi:peptidase inhibitor 16 precursor [Camelus ferus]|nr:peptidase inhibitor 16 precursor [Camelus ferus]